MPNINSNQPQYNAYQNNNSNHPNFPYYPNPNPNYAPPIYDQNEFFLQNLFNSNRIQNYEPASFNNVFGSSRTNAEEKNLLMRKLEQLQKYGRIFPNTPPNNSQIFDGLKRNSMHYGPAGISRQIPQYQDYSKNHLSEFFNRDSVSDYPTEGSNHYSKRHNKTRRKKMFDLQKEKYSLEETLKALDSKFESGNISEIDFFKNFKNLQKEIYIIEKNIEDLENEIEDEEFLRNRSKENDRKRYDF